MPITSVQGGIHSVSWERGILSFRPGSKYVLVKELKAIAISLCRWPGVSTDEWLEIVLKLPLGESVGRAVKVLADAPYGMAV